MHQCNVKVLGGLLIKVEFTEFMLEESDFKITHISGTPIRANYVPVWLYDRIDQAGDTEKVLAACHQILFDNKFYKR